MGKDLSGDEGFQTRKPAKGGFREISKRLRQGKENRLSHRATLDWHLDQREVCGLAQDAPAIVPIDELKALLLKSRTGQSLLEETGGAAIDIIYDMQTPVSQYYPNGGKSVVALHPFRPKGDLINLLTRELRRAWQHRNGALVNPLSFEPDDAILVNRAQQADVLMIAIKTAWELKLAGEVEAWDYLIGSPMADISRSYEEKAKTDFRTLNDGEASRAAYDKFFEDSRTKAHDKRIIHQMLLNETGYIKSNAARSKLSLELFQRLGQLPNGKNYLVMKSKRMPVDLTYAVVDDRSNANFLWFIKFERSFQEKEMQMVQESVKLSAEVVDFAKWSGKNKQTQTL